MRRLTGLMLTAAVLGACTKEQPTDQKDTARPQDPVCAEGDAECGPPDPPPPPSRPEPRPPREPREPPGDPRGQVIKVEKKGIYYHATVRCRNGHVGTAGSPHQDQSIDLAFNDCQN